MKQVATISVVDYIDPSNKFARGEVKACNVPYEQEQKTAEDFAEFLHTNASSTFWYHLKEAMRKLDS